MTNTSSDPEFSDNTGTDAAGEPDTTSTEPVTNAGIPGPDDEIQVTGHVLGPGDGEAYDGPATAQQDDSTDDEA